MLARIIIGTLALSATVEDVHAGRVCQRGETSSEEYMPTTGSEECWWEPDRPAWWAPGANRPLFSDPWGAYDTHFHENAFTPNPGESTITQNAKAPAPGCGEDSFPASGNPVALATGNKIETELDFGIEGEMGLYLQRTYNHYWNHVGLFGKHWLSNLDYTLAFDVPNQLIYAQRPDGRRIKFVKVQGQNRWNEDKATPVAYIEKHANGTYRHHTEDRTIEIYREDGRPTRIENRQGVGFEFSYVFNTNYLSGVVHDGGRIMNFEWTGGQLTKVTDPDGEVYVYAYDANAFGNGVHRLKSVTPPGLPATTVAYHYEENGQPGALTGKSFNGTRYSTFDYDADGRTIGSEHAGGVEKYIYSYLTHANGAPESASMPSPPAPGALCDSQTGVCTPPVGLGDSDDPILLARADMAAQEDAILAQLTGASLSHVDETHPLGRKTHYAFEDYRLVEIEGYATTHCAASYRERSYDANGNVTTAEDFNGNVVYFDYSANGQLQKRVQGFGTAQARTLIHEWDVPNNRITKTTVAGDREESLEFWPDHRLKSVTVKNLSAHGTPNQTRTTGYSYTHHGNGLVATMIIDGPLPGAGDAVTHTYSSTGDLIQVRNSLNHITTYSQHNGRGQPGRIEGPNGEALEYQYDARGRLTRLRSFRNGGQQDTTYAYFASGLLEKITTPDGATESYLYDNARRLKEIHRTEPDGLAKKLLTYNANSQVTRMDIYRGNTLRFRIWADYDELGRIRARRGNHGQDIRFTYDLNDNLKMVTDSLGKVTRFDYDALNRRTAQTDALNGITRFAYDAGNRIKQITDPRNLITTYAYDGFGQLRTQISPDTGTTTYTWDAGGLLMSTKRADNVTVSFGHDNLGRRISMSALGQSHTFTYDTCPSGLGRLCFAGASGYGENLSYSPYGEITNRLINHTGYGTAFNHGFQYDPFGRLTKLTYPNGVEATYGYTLDKVTSLTTKIGGQTKSVVSNITWEPMGPMRQRAFGNGGGRIDHYDNDYRLTDIETDLKVGYHFEFDANDRIEGTTNFAHGPWSHDFGYDELHRLKTATSQGLGSQSFTYDANGNRKTHGNVTYGIAATSNRLMNLTGGANRTYAYTQTGHVKTITGFGIGHGDDIFRNGFQIEPPPTTTFTYDPFDRLNGVTAPGLTASYDTGPDGTRFKKTVNNTITDFTYGPGGMLLTEHRRNPMQWTNYLWLDGKPVALVRANTVYWIQTDHLGRSEGITDQNKQRKWRAATMPFGRKVIDDHIGGFHLGFPGQYHDIETGFAYNIYRNFDSQTGRYLESDPIGLAGGINTYAYAGNNPVMNIDPLGLQSYTWMGPFGEGWEAQASIGIVNAWAASNVAETALLDARNSGLPGQHNGAADAYRHCIWSCMMAEQIGQSNARTIGDIHEAYGNNPISERNMDQCNNAAGRSMAGGTSSCAASCFNGVSNGALQIQP